MPLDSDENLSKLLNSSEGQNPKYCCQFHIAVEIVLSIKYNNLWNK